MVSRLLVLSFLTATSTTAAGEPTSPPLSCGPRALKLAAGLERVEISTDALTVAFRGRAHGRHSLRAVADGAEKLGLFSRAVRHDPGDPRVATVPMIIPVRQSALSDRADHFVVVYGRRGEALQVLDFPNAPEFIPVTMLATRWDGTGLYISRDPRRLGPGATPALVLFFGAALVLCVGGYRFASCSRKGVRRETIVGGCRAGDRGRPE